MNSNKYIYIRVSLIKKSILEGILLCSYIIIFRNKDINWIWNCTIVNKFEDPTELDEAYSFFFLIPRYNIFHTVKIFKILLFRSRRLSRSKVNFSIFYQHQCLCNNVNQSNIVLLLYVLDNKKTTKVLSKNYRSFDFYDFVEIGDPLVIRSWSFERVNPLFSPRQVDSSDRGEKWENENACRSISRF